MQFTGTITRLHRVNNKTLITLEMEVKPETPLDHITAGELREGDSLTIPDIFIGTEASA